MSVDAETRVGAVAEFLNALPKSRPDGWIYRGQRRAEWPLRPNILRARPRMAGATDDIRFVEAILLRRFKESVRLLLPVLPGDEWEWLALAQHHGLLTRLLDWTENPLVALYFAVETANQGDSVVWCAQPDSAGYGGSGDPYSISEVVVVHLPHVSPRMTVQKGLFTIHPIPEVQVQDWRMPLRRIVVDAAVRVAVRDELRHLGIDRAALFPDLDGIARGHNARLCLLEEDELAATRA